MKKFHALTATLALGLLVAAPTLASDNRTTGMQGSSSAMMWDNLSEMDRYKLRWAWYNLDQRELKRYHEAGYNDEFIRAAANVALRTGLEMDYILNRLKVTGQPIAAFALMMGVTAEQTTAEIPGWGGAGSMAAPAATTGTAR
jgi:hypothetical protein